MRPTKSPGRTELLASVPLFHGLSAHELTQIDALVNDIDVEEGEIMTTELERAQQSYIVVAGEALVSVDGREVDRLGPGGFFGAIATVEPARPRHATVTALTPMRLLVLEPPELNALVTLPCLSQRLAAGCG